MALQDRLGSRSQDPQEQLHAQSTLIYRFVQLLGQAEVRREIVGKRVCETVLVPDTRRGGFCEVKGLLKRDLEVITTLIAPLIEEGPNEELTRSNKEIAAQFGKSPSMINETRERLLRAYVAYYELDEPLTLGKRERT